VSDASITLDDAVDLARTGDIWLFRGHKMADRAIQVATNSPVNHVGMSVAIEDLPPLMWHAELGRSLPDVWTGTRQRGVQLHDLRAAVIVWASRYGQRAWLRQLDPAATSQMEEAVLRTIARLDGTPFPSTARLASGWLLGRVPTLGSQGGLRGGGDPQTAYCAEILAATYQAMGLLPRGRHPGSYDPGSFWSGDNLGLSAGFRLGGEIAVHIPAGEPGLPVIAQGESRLTWPQRQARLAVKRSGARAALPYRRGCRAARSAGRSAAWRWPARRNAAAGSGARPLSR